MRIARLSGLLADETDAMETSSTTFMWRCVVYPDIHDEVKHRFEAELDEKLGGLPSTSAPASSISELVAIKLKTSIYDLQVIARVSEVSQAQH
jgi:hypothetical protein